MRRLSSGLRMRNVGVAFALTSIVVIIVGHIVENDGFSMTVLFESLWANLGTDLAGVAVTVLVIDRLMQSRDVEKERERLIRNLHSHVQDITRQAVQELRDNGWLCDGSLEGAILKDCRELHDADLRNAELTKVSFELSDLHGTDMRAATLQNAELMNTNLQSAKLQGANLAGANLSHAKLQGADLDHATLRGAVFTCAQFEGANLKEADLCRAHLEQATGLSPEQLAMAYRLREAYMVEGDRYCGCYNLRGDVIEATKSGISSESYPQMASYYGVSQEDYQRGQDWRRENLPGLRGE